MGDYTEFQNPTGVEWTDGNKRVGMVKYGDGRMNVMFYAKPVLNPIKSQQMGKPFNETKIFIKIAEPGQRLTEVIREATDIDKNRYPQQWAAYQNNKQQIPDGVPVDLLFPGDPAKAENLKAWGFYTVEQVAHANAAAIQDNMGMQSWVNMANKFLEEANRGVGFHQHQKDLEDRDREIRVLKQQLNIMRGEVAHMRNTFQGGQIMQAQAMQAGMDQGRPVYPQQMQPSTQMYPQPAPGHVPTQHQPNVIPMPSAPLAPVFDSQTAQINSVQEQTVRRGRPPGSKNKPKSVEPIPVQKLEPPSL